ncbi:glycosyltransferase [Sulfuricella sp. T08]|uniref:glycosyltransferase family 4 protein n=1 Tax=Sulfuricella sp. T08 TaxID=1632857 RepID=UPI00061796E1|nr:glycosyltransferase family 4 protein [Sulfuricella sp. T08]GAO34772.1 glycosyltransferase [Sulfuricella sp. T08]
MSKVCYQINLQQGFGGGEAYTRFFSNVLQQLGWQVTLFVHKNAGFWRKLDMPGVTLVPVGSYEEIHGHLPAERSLFITHSPTIGKLADTLASKHILTGFAHMPLYNRNPEPFRPYHLIFAVSGHVIDSLRAAGIDNYYEEPLYGVADLTRPAKEQETTIRAASVYDWDTRKVRDRLLSHLYPAWFALKPEEYFKKRKGLTLGIVSRLTPIKQFPLMFGILAPILRQFPDVNLEIFGSGGYASVRDLRRSLNPIADQVRWWGHQNNMSAIYPHLDFLLTGLPEKEALGLNVIEAQACGTPVLAVNAPPFTETVVEGETGYFFTDPRQDDGRDFARLLGKLRTADGEFLDPRRATTHLESFSLAQFSQRVKRAMTAAARLLESQPVLTS